MPCVHGGLSDVGGVRFGGEHGKADEERWIVLDVREMLIIVADPERSADGAAESSSLPGLLPCLG